jgi:hypothetical protein
MPKAGLVIWELALGQFYERTVPNSVWDMSITMCALVSLLAVYITLSM